MASTPPSATSSNTTTQTSATRPHDQGNWVHGCFMVKVGTDFTTYKAILDYAEQDEMFGSNQKPAPDPEVKKILNASPGENSPLPIYFSKRKCRDSSLGGNDSINPLPQFSPDDDISHPHFYTDVGQRVGMGQVYSEHYDDLQQILYLGFGIPLFSNVGNFWATATDMEFAKFINKGSGITAEKIGYLIGSAPIRIAKIATIPYRFIQSMVNFTQQVPISKYYTFSSQMPMYFKFVNTILVMLGTNMNIMGSNEEIPSTTSPTSGKTQVGLLQEGTNRAPNEAITGKNDLSGLPEIVRIYGMDMAQIMTKRARYEAGGRSVWDNRWTDQAVIDASNLNGGKGVSGDDDVDPTSDPYVSTSPDATAANSPDTASTSSSDAPKPKFWTMQWFDNFAAAYKTTLYDGHLFIGFRVDKGMGGSESFSNSTGESQISQVANEKFQSGREMGFQAMDSKGGEGLLNSLVGTVSTLASGILKGLTGTFKMDPLGAAISGSARIAIPEVWMSSSYSRSASFSLTCLAPYGDFETIFKSLYVPLACILAGTLPRGTGHSSHSAPFVCQAYCKGIFSSPLCIIESLEVTRGADQFGMTTARLPTKLTMHVTLKDLSPVMYMNMGGDRGVLNAIFGGEDNFSEYLLTLSGMSLRDRLNPYGNMIRKMNILTSTFYKNKLSPNMMGMVTGSRFTLSRVISMIVGPGRNIPGS